MVGKGKRGKGVSSFFLSLLMTNINVVFFLKNHNVVIIENSKRYMCDDNASDVSKI
jgi:hypothetical protein